MLFTYPDGQERWLRRPQHPPGQGFVPRAAPTLAFASTIAPSAFASDRLNLWEDPYDSNTDGISGRARRVFSVSRQGSAHGRYGWKASIGTLEDQVANALAADMGLSNPLLRVDEGDNCRSSQGSCVRLNSRNQAQNTLAIHTPMAVNPSDFAALVAYLAGPSVARARPATAIDAQSAGYRAFVALGCTHCHQPHPPQGQAAAFTDLLLHNMGAALADAQAQGSAAPDEWRTAPLVDLVRRRNPNAGLLHDGRARTIEEAILWHGGEAEQAKQAFAHQDLETRQALLEFLEQL